MGFHLVSYFSSITNSSSLQQVTCYSEQPTPTRDNNYLVGSYRNLFGIAGFGTTLTRVQMQAPSLRSTFQKEIKPFANAAAGAGALTPLAFFRDTPLQLDLGEELAAYATQGSAGNETEAIFAFVADAAIQPVRSKILTVRITGTTTLAANKWTQFNFTFDQSPPPGRYQIVGGRMKSAGAVAWRVVFVDLPQRPGHQACQSDLANDPPYSRNGDLGSWGEFNTYTPPAVDIWSVSADTSETGELDLVKIG